MLINCIVTVKENFLDDGFDEDDEDEARKIE
jgi:hypothetical protein